MNKINIKNPVNSALEFISAEQNSPELKKEETKIVNNQSKKIPIQNRNKTDKNGRELKRKRYNLLLVPSIYKDIEKIAYIEKISTNEAINKAILLYTKENKTSLEKYEEFEILKK